MAMLTRHQIRLAGRWLAAGAGLAATSYAAYVATMWCRYGRATRHVDTEDRDALLDQFMPTYEVAERHHVGIAAPAQITFEAATEMYLQQSPIVRGIFKAREWVIGSHPAREPQTRAFLTRDACDRLGRAGRDSGPGDRDGRGDTAVDGRCRLPSAATRGIRRLSRTGAREDCLDVACRSERCRGIDLPDGDTGCHHRSDCPSKGPVVLGIRVAWHHLDSLGVARTVENGGGTPESCGGRPSRHALMWSGS
jgi:hypothetical protein